MRKWPLPVSFDLLGTSGTPPGHQHLYVPQYDSKANKRFRSGKICRIGRTSVPCTFGSLLAPRFPPRLYYAVVPFLSQKYRKYTYRNSEPPDTDTPIIAMPPNNALAAAALVLASLSLRPNGGSAAFPRRESPPNPPASSRSRAYDRRRRGPGRGPGRGGRRCTSPIRTRKGPPGEERTPSIPSEISTSSIRRRRGG